MHVYQIEESRLLQGFCPGKGLRYVPYLPCADAMLVSYGVSHKNLTFVLGLFGMIMRLKVNFHTSTIIGIRWLKTRLVFWGVR